MAIHREEGSEGAEASPMEASVPRKSLPVEAEGSREAFPGGIVLPRQRVIETTQEILVRIHTLCLQTMHDMGSVRELDQTLAHALMAEFMRLQLTVEQDLTRSLIALRINNETSSEAFLSDVVKTLNLHPTDPASHRLKAILQKFQQATSLRVNLPLMELQAAWEDMEGFLQCCLQEISSQAESRELIEGLTRKLLAHASRVQELVSIPELAEEEVSLRANTGLAANPPLKANLFLGILEGVAGRFGLVPPGVTDPPASARVGVSRKWAATLIEAVLKMEGRDIGVGPVTHDVLPSRVHLDYDPHFEARGVDDMAPVLTPSLLSGLVGNIHGPEKPGIPTQPIPFEAENGMGDCGWIPLKSEAPGPSHNVGMTPQAPVSKGVSKCKPLDQGTSQHDQLVFEVNPEVVAEVIVSDDDDLDLTLEEPQAISTPASEPAPHRKQSLDDQDPPSSPSRKHATKEEGMSTPYQGKTLPKGVTLKDILPKRYDTLSGDNKWAHRVRCGLLGLETGTTPSKEEINSSKRFTPRATAWETDPPEIITDHWLPILQEEGLLTECPPDKFTSRPGWVPLYTKESLTKHLPVVLSTFLGSGASSLMAVVPPKFQGSTNNEFLLTSFH